MMIHVMHPLTSPMCLQELRDQKAELIAKAQAMKAGLQEWRTKVDAQAKSYKQVGRMTDITDARRSSGLHVAFLIG
jgi:uncharacterized coiled-coil DUF342 family protein